MSDSQNDEKTIALVTGASRGIGAASVRLSAGWAAPVRY